MTPTVREGDTVTVRRTDGHDVKEGHVVVYYLPTRKSFVLHRVVKAIKRNGRNLFQTKGDNSEYPDRSLVLRKQIIGVATIPLFLRLKNSIFRCR